MPAAPPKPMAAGVLAGVPNAFAVVVVEPEPNRPPALAVAGAGAPNAGFAPNRPPPVAPVFAPPNAEVEAVFPKPNPVPVVAGAAVLVDPKSPPPVVAPKAGLGAPKALLVCPNPIKAQ